MLNSNGMDLNINSDSAGQYLEYNMIGGVIDLYILAGPGPVDVARQYSDVIGQPTMMPYWGFGFHQCRYGMQDVYEVAAVVANYSTADIPLETMWTDIDYMDLRKVNPPPTNANRQLTVPRSSLWTLIDSRWRKCRSSLLIFMIMTSIML